MKVKILWIDGDMGYARSMEYGDIVLDISEVKGKQVGDTIEIEDE
jgi:hypothetical protein